MSAAERARGAGPCLRRVGAPLLCGITDVLVNRWLSMNGIAAKLGIDTQSLHKLLDGTVTNGVASKVGSSTEIVQGFVDGRVAPALAATIGGPPDDLQRLRDRIGRDGVIGILIGLMAR